VERFLLLFVCTANQCRSAMAEQLVRQALAARPDVLDIEVGSAGTHAFDGIPMAGSCAAAVRNLGIEVHDLRSRRLTPALIAASGVLLTMERAHLEAASALTSAAFDKTFTLREFARLTGAGSALALPAGAPAAERARLLVALAARMRREAPPVTAGHDDIFDPIGGRAADVKASLELIREALDPPLRLILGPPTA
jgi:protein-tyrosine phosphatase